jgi:hypothetical protein
MNSTAEEHEALTLAQLLQTDGLPGVFCTPLRPWSQHRQMREVPFTYATVNWCALCAKRMVHPRSKRSPNPPSKTCWHAA